MTCVTVWLSQQVLRCCCWSNKKAPALGHWSQVQEHTCGKKEASFRRIGERLTSEKCRTAFLNYSVQLLTLWHMTSPNGSQQWTVILLSSPTFFQIHCHQRQNTKLWNKPQLDRRPIAVTWVRHFQYSWLLLCLSWSQKLPNCHL